MKFLQRFIDQIIYEFVLNKYNGIPGEPNWAESQELYLSVQQPGKPAQAHTYVPMHMQGFNPFPLRYDLIPLRYLPDDGPDGGIEENVPEDTLLAA